MKEFIFSVCATIGFSILFHVPKKAITLAAITGGIGWVVYSYLCKISGPILAAFIASLFIGLLGEIFARIKKAPVTVFAIPGIVPIVPGYGTYLSMAKLINDDYYEAAQVGIETVFVAVSISVGIIAITSLSKLVKKNNQGVD